MTMKKNKSVWIMSLVFLAGLLVLLYPALSNIIAQQTSNTEIDTYNAAVSNFTDEQSEEALKEAAEYNKSLAGSAISDPFSSSTTGSEQYNSLLNMSHGIMAYVEIPSINVYLPIYHGTDDTVLEKGAGHIYGTSLPVGGKGTHAVIAGHTGLPGKKLFNNLDKLKNGDTFTIHVLNKTLTYTVDQIFVVEPQDVSALQIVSGQDYVTLVTCTPYGINTHRLLVRGVRTNSNDAQETENQPAYTSGFAHLILSAIGLLAFLFLLYRFQKKYSS
jgi:sortase A